MPMVVFLKAASGPAFGPYSVGDTVLLSSQTITDLGDAVATAPVGAVANQPASTE